jgi:ribosomal subunit interface protein
METSDAVKTFAEKKVKSLDHLFSGLTQIEIVLDASGGGHGAELIAHSRRGERFVAESRAPDVYQAVQGVIDKMGRQLRERNRMLKERRKKGASAKDVALLGKAEEEAAPEEREETGDMQEIEDEEGQDL